MKLSWISVGCHRHDFTRYRDFSRLFLTNEHSRNKINAIYDAKCDEGED